jgi:hypothetical protein
MGARVVAEDPYDLPYVVDAVSFRKDGGGRVELRKHSASTDKTVSSRTSFAPASANVSS